MIHIMSKIRSFLIIFLCSQSIMLVASERPINPYYLNPQSSDLKNFLSGSKAGNSAQLQAIINRSYVTIQHGCDRAAKVVINNPKEASAVAALLLLSLMWYKSDAIKEYYKSESMDKYKQKVVGLRDSAVTTVDNQIAKIPFPFHPAAVGIRGLIAYLFNNIIAMDGEYVAGAMIAPILGYLNGYTPLAFLGGVKAGYLVSGGLLVRGWMGIDAAQINRNLKKVETKVDDLAHKVDQGLQNAADNHQVVLSNLQNLDGKIIKLSQDIQQEIEDSNKKLSTKIEDSGLKAEQSRQELKDRIENVNAELLKIAEQVGQLPSKEDVDNVMAKTVKSFQDCIASSVDALDKKTEEKMNAITHQLDLGFESINNTQSKQAEKIEVLVKDFATIIDDKERNIKMLTDLVDTTKISNGKLLEKFESLENSFAQTQEAFKQSDEKYAQLLEEKRSDWERLETKITEQIKGFELMHERLSQLENKIDGVDQKTNNQYENLLVLINSLKEENVKIKQEAALREKLLSEQINALAKAQNENNVNVNSLREDLKKNAKKVHKGQTDILDAINRKNDEESKILKIAQKPTITNQITEKPRKNKSFSSQNQFDQNYLIYSNPTITTIGLLENNDSTNNPHKYQNIQ